MGYRSQVVLAIGPEKVGHLLTMLSANEDAFQLFQRGLKEGKKDYEEKGDLLLVWNDIKWYTSYDDVGTFAEFIDSCMDDEEQFRFVRVGEEPDDIKILGEYSYGVYPSTDIIF
tara:strand:- start:569 stop:910 length:342 start_codon:yes stop_codon:yes gene_type:complete